MKKRRLDLWNKKRIETIKKDYIEGISGGDISKKFNCSYSTIYRILKENSVPIKNKGIKNKGTNNPMYKKKHTKKTRKKMVKSWDYNKHVFHIKKPRKKRREDIWKKEQEIILKYKDNEPIMELAKEFKCGIRLISKILRKNNVLVKNGLNRKIFYNKKELINRYLGGESIKEIAESVGIDRSVLWNFFKKQDLKLRPPSFYNIGKTPWNKGKKHLSMEKNPAWLGGISFEPYGLEFNNKLKEETRKRDNYLCQECRIKQKELRHKLSIHHIDYNKQNNSIWNLISLCKKCHVEANLNRKHWTNYFKMKMFLKEFFNPQNIKVFNEDRKLIAMGRIVK